MSRGGTEMFFFFFCEILLFRSSKKTKDNELRRKGAAAVAKERTVAEVCFEEKHIRVFKRVWQCLTILRMNLDTRRYYRSQFRQIQGLLLYLESGKQTWYRTKSSAIASTYKENPRAYEIPYMKNRSVR